MNQSDVEPKKRKGSERAEFEELQAAEKIKALEAGFTPAPSNEWASTKEWWANATDAERQDMVYGLVTTSAAKPKQIAKYFSIKEADLKPYQEQLTMGEAARILKINQHQMRWAISTNVPNAKFFLGLQFASQVQNPVHDDAPSLDEKKDNSINITVIGKDASTNDTNSVYDSVGGVERPLQ